MPLNSPGGSILQWGVGRDLLILTSPPPLHSAPPLGGPRRNIAIPFGTEKLE